MAAALSLSACMGAQQHQAAVANADKNRLSAAAVQREVHIGMLGAEVIAALGPPNIVTSDEQRRETWIYDRFATERVYSTGSEGLVSLLFGAAAIGSGGMGGAGGGGAIASAGAHSASQRTLTIAVKFDASGRVRDVAYRQSSF
jgi:hypothetical protein